ncbi:IAMT1 [Symbiodinium sp. KB8]|nr:IAMT1 [Symbiodinium sp. KB8]
MVRSVVVFAVEVKIGQCATNGRDIADSALDAVEMPSGRHFVLADYGTADGGTSIDLVSRVIGKVRERTSADQEVIVLYEDIPTNPFGPLFQMTQGMLALPGGRTSFLAKHPTGVFVHAVGTSFYRQCAPTGTVDFGMSFTAMHWTSAVPCPIPGTLHSVMAPEEVRARYAAQSGADWAKILEQRAKEMRPGARLIMANFCVDDKGCYLGYTTPHGGPSANMHGLFAKHWAELRDSGRITAEEFDATNFPQHYRTVDEFKAPLEDETSAAHRLGLRLETIETRRTPCPFATAWANGEYSGPEAFAKDYVPTLRSWSTSVFVSGLSESRPVEERNAIVEEFWGKYEAAAAADPAAHGMDYIHAFIVVRKESA